jgi:cytochrome c-type protein NapB
MKKLIGAMLACLMAGSLMAAVPEITNSTGGIKSGGEHGSGDGCRRGPMKNFRKDGDLYDRQYMHQPPLIPTTPATMKWTTRSTSAWPVTASRTPVP